MALRQLPPNVRGSNSQTQHFNAAVLLFAHGTPNGTLFCTVQALGIPFRARPRPGEVAEPGGSGSGSGSALTQRHSATLAGLQGFVTNALKQYFEDGNTLAKVVAMQEDANTVRGHRRTATHRVIRVC